MNGKPCPQSIPPLPGIGGGTDQDGGLKATTADEAARLPFFGIQTFPYKRASDPFTTPEVAAYRDYYYSQVANYLQGECNSTKPYAEQTDEVFIWNLLYVGDTWGGMYPGGGGNVGTLLQLGCCWHGAHALCHVCVLLSSFHPLVAAGRGMCRVPTPRPRLPRGRTAAPQPWRLWASTTVWRTRASVRALLAHSMVLTAVAALP